MTGGQDPSVRGSCEGGGQGVLLPRGPTFNAGGGALYRGQRSGDDLEGGLEDVSVM